MPALPDSIPPTEKIFGDMGFEDLWPESYITSVCHYLRAGTHLKIPEEFRELLPNKL